jgi:glycine/D-amino acid oxidase-like deaminating enzyme
MTDKNYDAIVVGGGVVGASAAFHLKQLGAERVALIERGQICTGGTAKSCAICRSHYSIPTNTEFAVKSHDVFRNFPDYVGVADAASGWVESGYLILADDRHAGGIRDNLGMQAGVGAETYEISKADALELHPRLNLDDVTAVGYEPSSGYADPYLTTTGFIAGARALGVDVMTETPVTGLLRSGDRVTGVRTAKGEISAGTTLFAVGPWSGALADWLGIHLPLAVSKHIVLTFQSGAPYEAALPIVKDMTVENKMYFRPASGGVVLVGTGDHGEPLDDADALNESVTDDFVLLMGGQIANRMPEFATGELVDSWAGPYDIPPDWNPVLGPVDGIDGLHIAYGFSGHGFKLSPVLGRVLAQNVLGLPTDVDIGGYRLGRFAEGALLTGTYGIGSIS